MKRDACPPDTLAADVARALLERAQARATRAEPAVEESSERRAAPPPIERPVPIDALTTRRHIEALAALLQAFTLRGRALAQVNVASAGAATAGPSSDAERRLAEVALRAHAMLVEHPLAARSLVAALAAEGRAHARTEEGAALRARLLRSRFVRRGALLWSSLTMGLIDDKEPALLPSAYLDVLVQLGERADLEQVLGDLREKTEP